MKRGQSGLSLIVGVAKPRGMTSHDVVNRCRSIFGERRVGHTGTLDPMASGVLPVCIGPATRLASYLTGHDKKYRATIAFGVGTDTDDAEGTPTRVGRAPANIADAAFARATLEGFVGPQRQMPPAYSAIKVGGKKSYEQARSGHIIDLAPRDVVVHEARLLGVREGVGEALPEWDVLFHVSKGTYIRALARDLGQAVGCPAHLSALERCELGGLSLDECVGLDALEELGLRAALDPVRLLGLRFAFARGELAARLENGSAFKEAELSLYEHRRVPAAVEMCACTAGVRESCEPAADGETIAVVAENKLKALYVFSGASATYRARCVFQTGVLRGGDLES